MQKIRIGYDLRWQTGTLVHYVGNLLKALVARGKDNFHFVCYSQELESQIVPELDGLVEIRRVPWSRYSVVGQFLLPGLLLKDRIKLFHSPFYMMPFFSHVPTVV